MARRGWNLPSCLFRWRSQRSPRSTSSPFPRHRHSSLVERDRVTCPSLITFSEVTMAVATRTPSENPAMRKDAPHTGTFARVSRYVLVRLLVLFATVVIGVYLTIMIANMGGY